MTDFDLPVTGAALAELAELAVSGPVTPVEVVETGFDHRVLLAHRDGAPWVFRFPRRPDVLPDLRRERRILGLLHTLSWDVAVPHWQVDTVVAGLPVVGYPAVPGRAAGHEPRSDGDFVLSVRLPMSEGLVRPLGAALAQVHGLPKAAVRAALGPADDDRRATVRDRVDRVAAALELPPSLVDSWRLLVDQDRWWRVPLTLVHGDVHPGHTLVDDTDRLTGLLDWTDGGWGDPAVDLVPTLQCYGPATLDRVVAAYRAAGGATDDPDLTARVRVLDVLGRVKAADDALAAGRTDLLPRLHQGLLSTAP